MRFWTAPVVGTAIAAVYAMIKLRDHWIAGGEHASRASGTMLAYLLIGAFIGLLVSLLLSPRQTE